MPFDQRWHLYVDGESHYYRSRDCWRALHPDASLSDVEYRKGLMRNNVIVNDRAHVFWDTALINYVWDGEIQSAVNPAFTPHVSFERQIYFTSFAGDEDALHAVRVELRDARFEPFVVQERKALSDHREHTFGKCGVIEKAKGVDIGLTVRLLEDAYQDNFDRCYLATSDVDYLPVIEAVRRRGKEVFVLGYRNGTGKHSKFEYVPDRFVDIGEHMKRLYEPAKST
jgi:uncharacterized LabA/DUF88 family protein